MLRVVAGAVLSSRGLVLVAKRAAPSTFFLPGGEPEPGEAPRACLERELREQLGVGVRDAAALFVLRVPAVLEGVPMELSVFAATLDGEPSAAAEIAALAWWPERTDLTLAAAVRDAVIPRLRAGGTLPGPGGERVERVPAEATDALRAAILRPGRGAAALAAPGDATAAFFAVLDAEDAVVATVNVRPAAPPWDPDGAGWWRLRGMATAPRARGRGHGAAVMWAALDHVGAAGGRLWCQARPAALTLYARAGFTPVGEPWDDPELGPHQALERAATR